MSASKILPTSPSRTKEEEATPVVQARASTVRDVALRAGVSTGTVSRVFNNNSTVKPKVRERVLEAIRELNWEPSAVARSMRAGATHAIGCIVSDVVQLTAAQMVTGAEKTLRQAGYAMFVASSHYDLEDEKVIIKSFRQRKIDGLILVISDDEDPALADELEAMNLPIVLWERDAGGRFTSVLSDHASGCHQAVSYLAGLGHQRIALVAGKASTWVGREMVRGFVQAHEELNLPLDQGLIQRTGQFDISACTHLLSYGNRPTAIVAPINDLAQVVSVARGMGLTMPKDLSVLSIGDSSLICMTSPTITAVRHNPGEIGKTAAELLLSLLDGDAEKRRVVFPAELIVRESCVPPVVRNKRRASS